LDTRTLLVAGLALACGFGAGTTGAANTFAWGNVAIGGGGFVSGIVASPIEPNLFYARTDVGGAYRWSEVDQKWVAMTDWIGSDETGLLGVEAIAVDPKTPGKVYMACGTIYFNQAADGFGKSVFLRSSNYGKTWERVTTWDDATKLFFVHGNGMGRGNGERLAIDPNNPDVMFYGSRRRGLWKSLDNGSSWAHVGGFTTAAGYDTTWNGCGFSFVQFAPGSSTTLYAGFLRASDNVFQSNDGGSTWSVVPGRIKPATRGGYVPRLMPQRIAISPDSGNLYITFGDGAGPHTMQWDDGWGKINDWYSRGAVLKYAPSTQAWTNVSPLNMVDPRLDPGSNDTAHYDDETTYAVAYCGISLNPHNPLDMVASDMGYRGPQFWKLDSTGKKWKDVWGSNFYRTTDGGLTWIKSFQYYWTDGGVYPTASQMNQNGIGWMFESKIHWSGSVVMDPFNPKRVFVSSGNGVYLTDDITDYTYTPAENSWTSAVLQQRQLWKVASHGIEEVVPLEVVSIPGGPLVSTIGDYDGFRHDDVTAYPASRLLTSVSGTNINLGTTRALAWAPKARKLVKVTDARSAEPDKYSTVPISPLQYSSDSGSTWSVTTYENLDTSLTGGASVGISTDGAVTLWTPAYKSGASGDYPVLRSSNSAWTTVSGIDGAWVLGDPVDASVFYAFKKVDGSFYKSIDNGATFSKASVPGASDFKKFRAAPNRTGDLWLPLSSSGKGGLLRSTDGGAKWTTIPGLTNCQAVSFGKGLAGSSYPSLFAFGTVAGVVGVFQSDDTGATWKRVDDDAHRYGGIANGEFVVGDMNTYGVVYMSTAGRGIAARLPSTTGAAIQVASAIQKSSLVRSGQILTSTGSDDLKLFDLRGSLLRAGVSDGRGARLDMTGLGSGLYLARWGRNSQAVLLGN
jgi:xyloglucan-specific exo-beta-1,4-glucanase